MKTLKRAAALICALIMSGTACINTGAAEYETAYVCAHTAASRLSKPTSVSYSATDKSVTFYWEAVKGAKGYRVYQYDPKTKSPVYVGWTDKTSCVINDLSPSTEYSFIIEAFDNGDEIGAYTDYITVKTKSKKTSNISKPSGIQKRATSKLIQLEWDAVPGAYAYHIYMYNAKTDKWESKLKTRNTSANITDVKKNTTYKFRIATIDTNGGEGEKTGSITVKTLSKEPTPLKTPKFTKVSAGKTEIALNWSAVKGAKEYIIYKYIPESKKYAEVARTSKTGLLIDRNISAGGKYYYKVSAVDKYGFESSKSETAKLKTKPLGKVTGIKSTASAEHILYVYYSNYTLTWNKVEGAKGYNLYYYNKTSKKYELLTSVTTNRYDNSSVLNWGLTYYIKIAAYNDNGEGPKSEKHVFKTAELPAEDIKREFKEKWECARCGKHNYYSMFACEDCNNLKPADYTWTCCDCGTTNLNSNPFCNKCYGLTKPID